MHGPKTQYAADAWGGWDGAAQHPWVVVLTAVGSRETLDKVTKWLVVWMFV